MTKLFQRADIAALWRGRDPFAEAQALQGEVYREVATRRTLRVVLNGQPYFLKLHLGVGWGEILKNLITLRLPVIGARNEFEACEYLAEQGIAAPKVAAFAQRGWSPADQTSFVLCDALEERQSLEDLSLNWHEQPPDPLDLRALTLAVADFAKALHGAGVIHRDFYICHLLMPLTATAQDPQLAVIDLHRAKLFQRIPKRWLERDLAAMLYSVMDLPVSRFAWLRFLRRYRGKPLPQIFAEEGDFWRAVYQRAVALYRKSERKGLTAGRFQPQ